MSLGIVAMALFNGEEGKGAKYHRGIGAGREPTALIASAFPEMNTAEMV
jgi:hypothetical protein